MKGPKSRSGPFALGPVAMLLVGLLFALSMLLPVRSGEMCACTAFLLSSSTLVLLSVLLVGNRAFGALTTEREKKTLDCLRLTQWSSHRILWQKLRPEIAGLGRLLLTFGPTVLATGAVSDAGLPNALLVLSTAALGGVMASVFGIFVSSLCDTTSRAVVTGWVGKGIWLLLTPLLDMVLAAVFVREQQLPVFDSFNPLMSLAVLVAPGASSEMRELLPMAFLGSASLATLAMWLVAARRFDTGMVASATLTDRNVHSLYRNGGAVRSLPLLQKNPAFLREFAFQLRSGAGRWPGYAVFLVLFLAPFLYAKSWAVKNELNASFERAESPTRVLVDDAQPERGKVPIGSVQSLDDLVPAPGEIHLYTTTGSYGRPERLILKGHSGHFCSRLMLHDLAGVRLPAHEIVKVVEATGLPSEAEQSQAVSPPTVGEAQMPLTAADRKRFGMASPDGEDGPGALTPERAQTIHNAALGMGLSGALVLLLLYLSIRCCGFLATAVTSENDRRSWTDLALSGMTATQFFQGKLFGNLLMPMIQMTVAFPVLFFFTASGSLGIWEIAGLYLYSLSLALTAGMVGLWSSATSRTSHEAHGKALGLVIIAFTLVPCLTTSLGVLVMVPVLAASAALVSQARNQGVALLAATGMSASILCSSVCASPITAALSFLRSAGVAKLGVLRHFAISESAAAVPAPIAWAAGVAFLLSFSVLLWQASLTRVSQASDDTLKADLAA